jgi:hypothetical protein
MPLGGFSPCPLPLGGNAFDGLTAEQHARVAADLKAVVQTAPFAVLTFDTESTTPIAYLAQHGTGVLAAPTLTLLGPGDVRVTWAASYLDEYDNAYAPNITHAQATAMRDATHTFFLNGLVKIESTRQVRVQTIGPFGIGKSLVTLVVW